MQREKVKSRGDPILLEMRNESVAGGPRWHHEIKDMVCVLAMGRRIRQADAKTIGPWIFFEEISVFWKSYKLKNAAIWPGLVPSAARSNSLYSLGRARFSCSRFR
jgi:hypothetical protein